MNVVMPFALRERRSRVPRSSRDDGFTLVELMVAITIMFGALTALAYTALAAFTDTGHARQRQSAAGLANEALEQVRALTFAQVANGLRDADLAADPDLNVAGTSLVTAGTGYEYKGESIPTSSGASVAPLDPHRATVQVGSTAFTVSVYVTRFEDPPNLTPPAVKDAVFRVSSVVKFNPIRRGTSGRVEAQSIVSFPSGCTSATSHPFAGPCEPFFYGSASLAPGGMTLTENIVGGGLATGSNVREATLSLPQLSSSIQIEQTSGVQGVATASAAGLKFNLAAPSESVGGVSITSASSTDPSRNQPNYSCVATSIVANCTPATPSPGGNANSGGASNVQLKASAGDPAQSISTFLPNSAANVCPTLEVTRRQADALPCGYTSIGQAETSDARMQLPGAGGVFDLASFGPSSGTSSYVNYDRRPSSTCTGTSGTGCVHSSVGLSLPSIRVGGVPGLGLLLNGADDSDNYLVELTNLRISAAAEAGLGSADPSTTITSGSIRWWNGAGYTVEDFSARSGTTLPMLPVVAGGVTITPSIEVGSGAVISNPATCSAGCTRIRGEARFSPALSGTFDYVGFGANFKMNIDLGSLTAKSDYQAPL